jgi:hypothetical protein
MPAILLASPNDIHYYGKAGPVQLPLAPDMITVMIDEAFFVNWDTILASDSAIDRSQELEPLWGGFFVIHLRSGNDPLSLIARLITRSDIAFAYPVFLNPEGKSVYITNHVVVNFNNLASIAQIDSIYAAHDFTVTRTLFHNPRYQVLTLPKHHAGSPIDIANQIFEAGLAEMSQPSFILPMELHYNPNDTYWQNQWYFKNTGQFGGPADVDIDLDEAFDYAMAWNDTILIAMIDNGLMSHPDFPQERIAWGWDYAGGAEWEGDSDYYPKGGLDPHGLAVTGIVAATTNNSAGLSGVVRPSQRVQIIAQKVFPDAGGSAPQWVMAQAFVDAADFGASIISCSWGCPTCEIGPLYDAITYADQEGALVFFSSGNNGGDVQYPANHPKVIAVGATDSLDQRWYYSSFGSALDVMAPSADIAQPWGNFWIIDTPGLKAGYSAGPHGCNGIDGDYNCRFGGTSAACPQVSGIAALILLRRPDLRSTWYNNHTEQVRNIIRYSSERAQFDTLAPPDDTSRVDDYIGWGRVNADRALMAVVRGEVNNDGEFDISDAVYLISYIFSGGEAPRPHVGVGDVDCNGGVEIGDAMYLIAYIFSGGPPPLICYHYTY